MRGYSNARGIAALSNSISRLRDAGASVLSYSGHDEYCFCDEKWNAVLGLWRARGFRAIAAVDFDVSRFAVLLLCVFRKLALLIQGRLGN